MADYCFRRQFQKWVELNYGENSRTKTITQGKYNKICRYLLNEEIETDAKFRFWVKSKGFRIIALEDDPTRGVLCVPVKVQNSTSHGHVDPRIGGQKVEYRRVAVAEDFYDIIRSVHLNERGVHVGQKKTYRAVANTYAFLPREAVSYYLMSCNVCKARIQKFNSILQKHGNPGSPPYDDEVSDSDMESSISSHDGDIDDDRNGYGESKRIKQESYETYSPSHPGMTGNGLESTLGDMDTALNGNGNHLPSKDEFLAPQGAYLPSYQAYSPERKQEVVNYARETTVREAARRYSVPRSTVQVWCKHGSPIRKEKKTPGHGGGRRLTYSSETDSRLLAWVVETQKSGHVVTRDQLQAQALRLIREECPEFKASSGWVEKFLLRHSLTIPVRGQPNSDNPQATTVITPVQSPSVTSVSQSVIKTPQGSPLATSTLDTLCNDDMRSDSLKSEEDDDTSSVDTASLHDGPVTNKDGIAKFGAGRKDQDDDDADDDDVDGDGDGDSEMKLADNVNPERLKAFNMFVRLFVDENLDRLVPISKQPKDKILAIIQSCQRQFPEFRDRARKRIRTYLKSCRRLKKLKEPLKRTADQISSGFSIPSAQMAEVNNILANACASEAEQAKRIRLDPDVMHPVPQATNVQSTPPPPPPPPPSASNVSTAPPSATSPMMSQAPPRHPSLPLPVSNSMANTFTSNFPGQERTAGMRKGFLYEAVTAAKKGNTQCQLNPTEIMAVRQLIAGYRESAAFLYRSADELEALLPPADVKH